MSLRFMQGPFVKRFGEKQGKFKTLGEGQYGQVLLVPDRKLKKDVAVKMIKKTGLKTMEDKIFMKTELKIHATLDHPHIVKLYDHFQDKKAYYMVMELMGGGELFDKIFNSSTYTERKAAVATRNIAEALHYLHSQQIVHRDMKPENLLLPEGEDDTNVKLADFGIAASVADGPLHAPYGTLMYIAPEILTKKPYKTEIDIWSLGVIVYIMLCGYPPFYNADDSETANRIVSMELECPEEDWGKVSPEARDLVEKMLDRDQSKRLTAEQVLNHPWVKNAEEVQETAMDTVGDKLRDFQAKAIVTRAIHGVKAIGKLRDLVSGSFIASEIPKENLVPLSKEEHEEGAAAHGKLG